MQTLPYPWALGSASSGPAVLETRTFSRRKSSTNVNVETLWQEQINRVLYGGPCRSPRARS